MAGSSGLGSRVQHSEVLPKGALVMSVELIMKFQSVEDRARGKAVRRPSGRPMRSAQ
jgi:hypothetical protein